MKKLSLALLIYALGVSLAQADVEIQESYQTSGFLGLGAIKGETNQKVQGPNSFQNSTSQMSGALMGMMAGQQAPRREITLIRVLDGKKWTFNPAQKTYTETPLKAGKRKSQKLPQNLPLRLKKTSFKFTPTPMQKVIHGFKTHLYKASFLMKMENQKTQQLYSYEMKIRLWTAPWTPQLRKARRELDAFNAAYLKKAGSHAAEQAAQSLGLDMLQSMTHSNGQELNKGIADFKKQMSKINGFPIETDTDWYASLPGQNSKGAANSLGSLPPSLPKSVQKALGGLLQAENPKGGKKPVISIRTTISSVSVLPLPKKDFEVPAGYHLK